MQMISPLLLHQNLLREFLARDLRTRYVGSSLGFFWSVLNPLLQLALYTTVFSVILGLRFDRNGNELHFAAFLFCALLPWISLQESVTRAARIFIDHRNLIQKSKFPLEVLPFTMVASATAHQILGSLVFACILLLGGSLRLELLPLLAIIIPAQMLMAYGLAMATACLNVFIRDIAQMLGVGFMLLFWMTPIVYPKSEAHDAPGLFQWILNLNPLTHMVELYRYAFFGAPVIWWPGVAYWVAFCGLCYLWGRLILRRTRIDLVDLL